MKLKMHSELHSGKVTSNREQDWWNTTKTFQSGSYDWSCKTAQSII